MGTYYLAGAPRVPTTTTPNNVTGECEHRHRSPGAAQSCIDDLDRSIKRGHGRNAYARVVMVVHDSGDRHVHGTGCGECA